MGAVWNLPEKHSTVERSFDPKGRPASAVVFLKIKVLGLYQLFSVGTLRGRIYTRMNSEIGMGGV